MSCSKRLLSLVIAAVLLFSCVGGISQETQAEPTQIDYPESYTRDWLDKGLAMTEEEIEYTVEALLNTMNDEEFYSIVIGQGSHVKSASQGNPGYSVGLAQLGVPEAMMHDGPAGVTSIYETTGFPVNMSLASTFSEELAYEYGKIEGADNVSIGANWQLGAQMDISRTAHWARSKDSMGEDPFLTGTLGAQQITGIQEEGTVAMLKHYTGYGTNGDTSLNVVMNEQTLHEIYLPSFEKAAVEGNAGSIMTTYNKLQITDTQDTPVWTSKNTYTLTDVLRTIWNWKGMTCPDWGGNREMSIQYGMDHSQPGGDQNTRSNIEALINDPTNDYTFENVVVVAARHTLTAWGIGGYLAMSFENTYEEDGVSYVKRQEGRDMTNGTIELVDTYAEDYTLEQQIRNNDLVRKVAEQGAVLMKNDNDALPLKLSDYTGDSSVAMIGLGAQYLISGTGAERAYGVLKFMDSPYDSIMSMVSSSSNIELEVGLDELGTTIPAEYIYQNPLPTDGSAADNTTGWVRTYGVQSSGSTEEPAEFEPGPGGTGVIPAGSKWELFGMENKSIVTDTAGNTFMKIDKDGEGVASNLYGLGDVAQIDPVIEFTAGHDEDGYVTFYNGADGNAITDGEVYTWTGYIQPPEDGNYKLILQSIGGTVNANIAINGSSSRIGASGGTRQSTQWGWDGITSTREGMNYSGNTFALEADQRYKITITGIDMPTSLVDIKDMQIRLTWIPETQAEANYDNAVELARTNDKVLFFAYHNRSSRDGDNINLPSDQLKLLKDVTTAAKAAGNQVIVVLTTSTAISFVDDTYFTEGLGWIDEVDGILEMWFSGQAGGTATANILLGKVSPSGSLPMTFPVRNNETLLTINDDINKERAGDTSDRDSSNMYTAYYSEGIFMGYRWYDNENVSDVDGDGGVTPAFDFGHGLSYTEFEYTSMEVVPTAGSDYGYDVTVTVKNTGSVTGSHTVELYLGEAEVPDHIQIAKYQLAGFGRIEDLRPGASRKITIQVSQRSLSYWDSQLELIAREDGTSDKWVVALGERNIYVGSASDDLILYEIVNVSHNNKQEALLALQNVIDTVKSEATQMKESSFTPESWSAYESALSAAEAILADAESYDIADITSAGEALMGAYSSLVYAVNRDALSQLIAGAKKFLENEDKYIPSAVANLKTVIAEVEVVLNDPNATQTEVNNASKKVVAATEQLFERGDLTELRTLYAMLSGLDSNMYTATSWAVFKNAMDSAAAMLEDGGATAEEISDVIEELYTAFEKLKFSASKEALNSSIAIAEDILNKSDNYVSDSLTGLQRYLNTAKAVSNNPDATQNEVDTALAALTERILAARLKPALKTTKTAYILGYGDGTVQPENNILRQEVAQIFYNLLTDESKEEYEITENDFTDVADSNWANTAISTLANAGILSGYGDGTFEPGKEITRAELVTVVTNFYEVTGVEIENPFSDIAGHWAEEKILFAADEGWVQGYPDGTFKPDQSITRAETVTVVNAVIERDGDDLSSISNMKTFVDNANTNAWYYKNIQLAANSY